MTNITFIHININYISKVVKTINNIVFYYIFSCGSNSGNGSVGQSVGQLVRVIVKNYSSFKHQYTNNTSTTPQQHPNNTTTTPQQHPNK